MTPTIAPPVVLIILMAALSFNAALIFRKPWMQRVALGCGVFEVGVVVAMALMT